MTSEEKIIVSVFSCFAVGFGVGFGFSCGVGVLSAIGHALEHETRRPLRSSNIFGEKGSLPNDLSSQSKAEYPTVERKEIDMKINMEIRKVHP